MGIEILQCHGSVEGACLKAAQEIFATLSKEPRDKSLVVGLCGGRSVVGLVKALRVASAEQPRQILERIHFFMIDERITPLSSPDSNFGALRRDLFDDLVGEGFITESQLHPFVATPEDASTACVRYFEELSRHGGSFAVVVLGTGEDGHVAGLFPRHPALREDGRGFACFFDSPKPPKERMTATGALITDAKLAILLALGEGKKEAWKKFQDPAVSLNDCPAKLVMSIDRCLVVTDISV